MASVSLLHTNDLHGSLDDGRESTLAALRAEVDFYFDTGDAIRSGNLAVPFGQEPVWERFGRLGLTAHVIGNRETHLVEAGFKAKLAGAPAPVLCANLRLKSGERPLAGTLRLEANGVRVGVFAVSVPMVTERMAVKVASAYIWDQPIPVSRECVAQLRDEVDLLIGLTHIGHRVDLELAERVPGIDILLTGHSHTILEQPLRVGSTWICQGGSHGRFAGVYRWTDGRLEGGLRRLT